MRLLFILFLAIISGSCSERPDNQELVQHSERIAKLESLLYTHPEIVIDSLTNTKCIYSSKDSLRPAAHKSRCSAYKSLLYTIAFVQNYGYVKDDSLINSSLEWFRLNGKESYNICRALVYKGISEFSRSRQDSSSYLLFKEAEELYSKGNFNDPELGAMLFLYLGKAYRIRSNLPASEEMLHRAIQFSSGEAGKRIFLNSSLELFSLYLSLRRYSEALEVIACFGDEESLPSYIEYNLYNALFNYYSSKKDTRIAIEYLKKILSIKNPEAAQVNFPRVYYQLATLYKRINQPDSTFHYAKKSVSAIIDSNGLNSHFYYRYLADIYESNGDYKNAANYLRKAHNSYISAYTKLSEGRIIELEKKYDLSEKERRLKESREERNILMNVIYMLVILFIFSILTCIMKIRRKMLLLEGLMQELSQLEIENNKLWLTTEIGKSTSFILPQMIDNVYIEAARSRKISNEIFDSLNSIIDQAGSTSRTALTSVTSSEKFKELFGGVENIHLLTDFEKLVFTLSEMGYNNSDIANFLNSSQSSIRTMRGKIMRKMHKNSQESDEL